MNPINLNTLVAALKQHGKLTDDADVANLVRTLSVTANVAYPDALAAVKQLAVEWVAQYTGSLPFVHSLKKTPANIWSIRQLKGALNCVKADPSGHARQQRFTPRPEGAAPPAKTYDAAAGFSLLPLSDDAWRRVSPNPDLVSVGRTGKRSAHMVYCNRTYVITQAATGKWADFIFISGGLMANEVTVEQLKSPHLLPKIGMQAPGGEFRLAASIPFPKDEAVAFLVSLASVTVKTSATQPAPPPITIVEPLTLVADAPAPAAVEEKPKRKRAEPKEQPTPVSDEPAVTDIRALVRQRMGLAD